MPESTPQVIKPRFRDTFAALPIERLAMEAIISPAMAYVDRRVALSSVVMDLFCISAERGWQTAKAPSVNAIKTITTRGFLVKLRDIDAIVIIVKRKGMIF